MTHGTDDPDLRETPGGWLALAVDTPRIAVLGATQDAALAAFREERAIWRALLDKHAAPDGTPE